MRQSLRELRVGVIMVAFAFAMVGAAERTGRTSVASYWAAEEGATIMFEGKVYQDGELRRESRHITVVRPKTTIDGTVAVVHETTAEFTTPDGQSQRSGFTAYQYVDDVKSCALGVCAAETFCLRTVRMGHVYLISPVSP
jgi:hypothetical protein